MKKLVRYKACGYIMEEGFLKDVCPACGVPKTAFESYVSKISEKRENILELDIHPIIVHLPMGFIISFPFVILLGLIFPSSINSYLIQSSIVIGVAMPVLVILGFITGIIDGNVRFKKLTTPQLIKKIFLGTILLVFSLVLSILILLGYSNIIVMLIFSLVYITLGTILGKIGANLMKSALLG